MSEPLFRRTTVLWLIAIAAVSLVAAVVLVLFGDDLAAPPPTAGATTFSQSAIGHRALAGALRRLGVPVVISQGSSGTKAGAAAPLLIIEPGNVADTLAQLRTMLGQVATVLVVLPKWTGDAGDQKPGWLDSAELVAEADVAAVIAAVVATADGADEVDGGIVRGETGCGGGDGDGGPVATLRRPQLLDHAAFETVVACGEHALVAVLRRSDDTAVYLLSDPDLIANHGLGDGDNAVIAIDLIEQLRGGTHPVIIDESIHGYRSEASLGRALVEFPLLLATLQALLALAALLLATTVRFGAPLPAPPAIAAGKQFLIDNIAALLHFGGHAGHTLVRYLDTTVRGVGRSLHAPPDLDDAGLRAWLTRVGAARGVTTSLTDLEAEVGAAATVRRRRLARIALAAERVHHWKQEMLRGAVRHRDHH